VGLLDRFCSIVWRTSLAVAFAAPAPLLMSTAPAHAEKRVAFVVGIKDYLNLIVRDSEGHDHLVGQLKTPLDDAETMAATLASLKFDVTLAKNVTRKAFLTEFESFKSKITPGDTALFFYSGHGIALQGGNFLLPSDTDPPTPNGEQLLREWAIPEVSIIAGMQSRGAGLMILVDACRNNPLTAVETTQALADGRPVSSLTRALPTTLMRGLTLPQIPTDVVGIYSAGFGQTALDNLPSDGPEQKNSVFVRVFVAKIKQPGVSLFEVMPDVQTEVADLAATVNEPDGPHLQTPAFLSQSRRQIYLAGLPPRSAPGSAEAPPAQPAPAIDPAAQAWAATQSTTSEAVLEDFIRQFGSTVYGSMARARLAELKTSKLAAASRMPSQEETAAQVWAATKDMTSVAVLGAFARQFGSTVYGSMARARVEELNRNKVVVVAPPASAPTNEARHNQVDPPRPAAPPATLLASSTGRWAIGDSSNCQDPSKSYFLTFAAGNITWRSGVGNTDIESIDYNGEAEFRTTTLKSTHRSGRGQAPGTSWVYSRIGPDRIQVKPGGRSSFLLARCP
jgi:hypothetical protein